VKNKQKQLTFIGIILVFKKHPKNKNRIIHCTHSRELLIALLEYYSDPLNSILIIRESSYIQKKTITKIKFLLNSEIGKSIYFIDFNSKYKYISYKLHELYLALYFKCKYQITNIIVFCDGISLVNIFAGKSICLYEHGLVNYQAVDKMNIKKTSFFKKIKDKLFYESQPTYGRNKNISSIHLFQPEKAPKDLGKLALRLNINELWGDLSLVYQNKILDVFNVNIDELKKLGSHKNIIFTQPISEQGFVTEEHKLSIYKRIIKEYGEGDCVIKVHPREQTDYKKHFSDVVIDNNAPFEIYTLLGVNFKMAITLYSSVVYSFTYPIDVVFLGVKYDSKLLESRGDFEL